MADLIDEMMEDEDDEPDTGVRFIVVNSRGVAYRVRGEQDVIWFPSLRMKGRRAGG